MFLKEVKEKHQQSLNNIYLNEEKVKIIQNKIENTNLEKYNVNCVFKSEIIKEKIRNILLEKYNVEHYSKTDKFREETSNRMIKNNPMIDIDTTLYTNFFKIKKYKDTELTYQSSYEYNFLELCEKLNIINYITNGSVYSYSENNKIFEYRLLTDYKYKEYDIEIKSSWVLEKQGGINKLNAKKETVEEYNRKYLLILDKNYVEFLNIINQ